ncbi:MAG: D-alanyl-D-alanine carboxypeptidase [Alphaproteobacteria bacterium]|nr:D-alanyl-D-alanine carboxypeptidase [Alphaproteobacteria bacterium]MBU0797066.1 D-alanyl-D-alanine carboxypeptidase [Alphaproteobacteria bacterium]MBU0887873.1 D-alanyl-D-alanine carboxypeptidase [Alphaproteobacteria bacterium]MBU1814904.1 D-alanyl-D-alanine carboxypeptidase [Alphaproteobacteria bacterium]MBU2090623.1 D-alanyl-D-alanine carboxypeptidase [Alphaproteobacteria bacterium]
MTSSRFFSETIPNLLHRAAQGIARTSGVLAVLALAATPLAPAAAQTIETSARQVFMVDFDTGTVLLEKNADEMMPPASMSKLMTVYAVFQQLKEGNLKLTDELPVSEEAWRKGGSKMFVELGSRIKVEDLLRGVIVQSGNDACIVLAEGLAGSEQAFADRITGLAREIGLERSVFKNATGWPDPEHLMTPRELALLAGRLIRDFPEHYHYYAEKEFTYNGIKQGNRNPLLYSMPGADGLKTGHTEASGYGLTASVKRGDRRLILVVNGLPSMNARTQETARLMDWGFREFDNYALFKAGETVEQAEVWHGEARNVPLVAAKDITATLPRSARKEMVISVAYQGPIAAPIQKGDPIAVLRITASGGNFAEIPLVAGADVPKLGLFGRMLASAQSLVFGQR